MFTSRSNFNSNTRQIGGKQTGLIPPSFAHENPVREIRRDSALKRVPLVVPVKMSGPSESQIQALAKVVSTRSKLTKPKFASQMSPPFRLFLCGVRALVADDEALSSKHTSLCAGCQVGRKKKKRFTSLSCASKTLRRVQSQFWYDFRVSMIFGGGAQNFALFIEHLIS